MPTFYFHVREGSELTVDPEGAEFSDIEAARGEAIASVKQAVAQHLLKGGRLSEAMERLIEIADESGKTLSIMTYAEAAEAPDHRP